MASKKQTYLYSDEVIALARYESSKHPIPLKSWLRIHNSWRRQKYKTWIYMFDAMCYGAEVELKFK